MLNTVHFFWVSVLEWLRVVGWMFEGSLLFLLMSWLLLCLQVKVSCKHQRVLLIDNYLPFEGNQPLLNLKKNEQCDLQSEFVPYHPICDWPHREDFEVTIKSCILPLKQKVWTQLSSLCMTPSPHSTSSSCTLHFGFVSVIGSHPRWPLKYSMHSWRCFLSVFLWQALRKQDFLSCKPPQRLVSKPWNLLTWNHFKMHHLFFFLRVFKTW